MVQCHVFTLVARDAIRRGVTPIIIDNTNTRAFEMKPYVAAVSIMK